MRCSQSSRGAATLRLLRCYSLHQAMLATISSRALGSVNPTTRKAQLLAVLAAAGTPDFESVWVDDSAELEQRYGTRVPVLRDRADGRELDWPFDAAAVRAFLDRPL